MKALLIVVVIGAIMSAIVLGVAWVIANRKGIDFDEKRLDLAEETIDDLQELAGQHAVTEPFAQIVLDELNKYRVREREIR